MNLSEVRALTLRSNRPRHSEQERGRSFSSKFGQDTHLSVALLMAAHSRSDRANRHWILGFQLHRRAIAGTAGISGRHARRTTRARRDVFSSRNVLLQLPGLFMVPLWVAASTGPAWEVVITPTVFGCGQPQPIRRFAEGDFRSRPRSGRLPKLANPPDCGYSLQHGAFSR